MRAFHLSKARVVLAFLVTMAASAAVEASATPGLIATYQALTNVDNYLNKDLIQLSFEAEMSESCWDFDDGKMFWEDPDVTKGGYHQSIPTYDGSVSDEWNEYIRYFGDTPTFHIEWVNEAFARQKTAFERGNANFKKAFGARGAEGKDLGPAPTHGLPPPPDGPCVGYEQSVKKTTSYLFSFIEAIQLLQKAIDLVEVEGCDYDYGNGCQDALEAWDASVAIYVGSLEGTDGRNCSPGCYGKSIYGLTDKRCDEYAVCGHRGAVDPTDKSLQAFVNGRIMIHYSSGQAATGFMLVEDMKNHKRMISAKMGIPFLQGTLRYAWRLSNKGVTNGTFPKASTTDKEVAEGGTFAMFAIPKLWACSAKGAKLASTELKIGGSKAGTRAINFDTVKLAFECNYRCLGVSCSEVGALFDGDYPVERSAMCDDAENGSDEPAIASCGRPSATRAKKCRRFTNQPGIDRRDRFGYFEVGLAV